MIKFDNVTKLYKNGVSALQNLSLEIDKGDFVSVVGVSGAGKSTFLKLIVHEEVPTEGNIIVDEYDFSKMKKRDVPYLRRNMGIVFQNFRLIEKMSIYDNVAFAMRITGASKRLINRRVPYVLNLVGMSGKYDRLPAELSGGEQQRVGIARALVNNPKLLIADEPTGNLDPALSTEIIELFRIINEEGVTVVLSTHEHDLVRKFSKRIIVLENGMLYSDTQTVKSQECEVARHAY